MTSHLIRIAAVATAAIVLSACVKIPGMPGAGPPGMSGGSTDSTTEATPAYQMVMIAGSAQAPEGIIRINTSTGQTVTAWGAPSQMVTVPDTTIPTGRYRLYSWGQPPGSDGSITWGASRVDQVSGRVWILNGCGSSPCSWIEVTPPSK